MAKMIYAIYDNVADAIIGGLHLHSHSAPAIRMFSDIAADPATSIARHPKDFDLLLLGILEDTIGITPTKETILTGATWAAAQQPISEEDQHAI